MDSFARDAVPCQLSDLLVRERIRLRPATLERLRHDGGRL